MGRNLYFYNNIAGDQGALLLDFRDTDRYFDLFARCTLQTSIILETWFETEVNELYNQTVQNMTKVILGSESKIDQVLDVKLPVCTNSFTDLVKKTNVHNDENYYYTFKLLWFSELAHFKNCDNGFCMFKETKNKNFLVDAVQNIFSSAKTDGKEFSCYNKTNTECENAIANLNDDFFNNNAYQQQANDIEIALKGVTVGLRENFLSWIISNKDCFGNVLVDCGGKLRF